MTTERMAERCDIVPRHGRLLQRFLEMLAEDRISRRRHVAGGQGFGFVEDPQLPVTDCTLSGIANELAVVQRCAPRLAGALQGKVLTPRSVIPQKGSQAELSSLYGENPGAFNGVIQEAVQRIRKTLPPATSLKNLWRWAGTVARPGMY